jgi:hypothetical protein
METIVKNGKTKILYSYNELLAIYGPEDKQVKGIKEYLDIIGFIPSNCDLPAFSRC